MTKRLINIIAILSGIISCTPIKEKIYEFGKLDDGIMVVHSSKDCKFDVSLVNNTKQFSFGYLELDNVYNFESSELAFFDSQNEKISFDEFGIYTFKNIFEERIISISYSRLIHESITLNDCLIRLNVCQRYYIDLDHKWNNA